MRHEDFSHILEHERTTRRRAAITLTLLTAVVLFVLFAVIMVMAWR